MVWHAKPGCPKHLVAALERHVNALPAAYLLPPQSGEIFDNIPHYKRRLRGYSLAKGFDIVQTGGGKRSQPGARWECCYHSNETKNWRHLEDHVECNKKGQIISKCQRKNTIISKLD